MIFDMKSSKLILLFCSVAFFSPTNAALITQTWTGTIISTNLDDSYIGQTFDVLLTYDNESNVAHQYLDGSNDIAEFGAGDDVIGTTHCTDRAQPGTSCDHVYTVHPFLDDASINLDEVIALFDGIAPLNAYSYNYSMVYQSSDFVTLAQYAADSISWRAGLDGNDYATTFWYDSSQTDFYRDSHSASFAATYALSVPEPSIIILMTTGFVGLGLIRKRRK